MEIGSLVSLVDGRSLTDVAARQSIDGKVAALLVNPDQVFDLLSPSSARCSWRRVSGTEGFLLVTREALAVRAALALQSFTGYIWLNCQGTIFVDPVSSYHPLQDFEANGAEDDDDEEEDRREWLTTLGLEPYVSGDDDLVNIQQDQLLTRRLRIQLGGDFLFAEPWSRGCRVEREGDKLRFYVAKDALVLVNGEQALDDEELLLSKGDTISFGFSMLFVFGENHKDWNDAYFDELYDEESSDSRRRRRIVALIAEANALAEYAGRNDVKYELVNDSTLRVSSSRCEIDDLWSEEKLARRIFRMRPPQIIGKGTRNEDPFFDPPDHRLVGVAYLSLDPISYLMEVTEDALPIVNSKGNVTGILKVRITPTLDEDENEEDERHIGDHMGKIMTVEVKVASVTGRFTSSGQALGKNKSPSIFVRTKWFLLSSPAQMLKTARAEGVDETYKFDANFRLRQIITGDLLTYLREVSMEIEVWSQ